MEREPGKIEVTQEMVDNINRLINERHEDVEPEDWPVLLDEGREYLEGSFVDAALTWCDALDIVPDEDFDELYSGILDSLEKYIVQRAWKTIDGIDITCLDELAITANICSPDKYDLIPDLIERLMNHLNDMPYIEYCSELLDGIVLIARTHFDFEVYITTIRDVGNKIAEFCGKVTERAKELETENKDTDGRLLCEFIAAGIRETFVSLSEAITKGIGERPDNELYEYAFEWREKDSSLFAEHLDNAIEMSIDNLNEAAAGGEPDYYGRDSEIRRFVDEYFSIQLDPDWMEVSDLLNRNA